MSSCARVIHQEGRGHFLIGRNALFWSNIIKELKRRRKVACGVMDWDGGSIENLVRRIIRSVQEPSADYGAPQLSRQQQVAHGKSKSLTEKANSLTSKADGSRQKQINSLRYFL